MNEGLISSPCIKSNRVIRENVVRRITSAGIEVLKKGTFDDIVFGLMLLANRRYNADDRICTYGWKIS